MIVPADLPGPEGFVIGTQGARLTVLGADERGVLFGVGRLLRELRITRHSVVLEAPLNLVSEPALPLRGHQLGYRPKTNSYDGWDLRQWEQYYRDLIVWGTNAVELIPPRSDDDADSPHFPLPPLEMMIGMSRLADDYGLDVWIWYPALDPDYTTPAARKAAVEEWGEIFKALPRVDAAFVPGGDPGHTAPADLMELLRQQTENLRRYHPHAVMWVSPQGFSGEWMEEFLRLLEAEPEWLAGVVHGPQVRISLAELRKRVPGRYPIRSYPDITHTRRCQFPVPDWDPAFAATLGREPINPRPQAMAAIFRQQRPDMHGFLTYSEGCNDDVNKCVWSALGWDPDAQIDEILRQYARCFCGPEHETEIAAGIAGLEHNWVGSAETNAQIQDTQARFEAVTAHAPPALKQNWRFQQLQYRAAYDAYVRVRVRHEQEPIAWANRRLPVVDIPELSRAVSAILRASDMRLREDPNAKLRLRLFVLAEALFQSVRMQLSVPLYQAIAQERGANLDAVDAIVSDLPWLVQRLRDTRELPDPDRRRSIRELLTRTDPGPGGFYDALGIPALSPRLLSGPTFEEDPAQLQSVRRSLLDREDLPLTARAFAETLYERPLRMRYEGLDHNARYRLRITYSGDAPQQFVRLATAEGTELHPLMAKPDPTQPLELDVPPALTADGTLELHWTGAPRRGGNGRGCQVAEVWLLRKGG
jgi:hypothetical protein